MLYRQNRGIGIVLVLALVACSQSNGTGADASAEGSGDAATTNGGPHPFGSHGGYVAGVDLPGRPQAELDAATAAFYDTWKARYLVAGCAADEYRIVTAPATDAYTVSEGHGYGMLIAAIFDGHDPEAHEIFDGLYRYYTRHPSSHDAGLMAWAQDQACADVMGVDSATDGDLDIAYALLLADRQWGSQGLVDYRAAAVRTLDAILAHEVHPSGSLLVGDWVDAADTHYKGTRPSDFMTGHFESFANVGDVARWTTVRDRAYAIIAKLQATAGATTGLVPDFVVAADGDAPQPAPANWLEGADDGHYGYNACRVPWRLTSDFVLTGDPRARTAILAITAWVRGAAHDDVTRLRDGYRLDGVATGTSPELPFVAPLLVGAMIDPGDGSQRTWLDALWANVTARALGDYYGDTIKLLAMVVASGNWWRP